MQVVVVAVARKNKGFRARNLKDKLGQGLGESKVARGNGTEVDRGDARWFCTKPCLHMGQNSARVAWLHHALEVALSLTLTMCEGLQLERSCKLGAASEERGNFG